MANDLTLNVKLSPKIDPAEVKKILAGLGNLDLNSNIAVDTGEFEKVVSSLESKYEEIANNFAKEIILNVDTQAAEKDLNRLEESMSSMGDGLAGVNIDELAQAFEKAYQETETLLDIQQKALAQMKMNGSEGSQAYQELEAAITETSNKMKEFGAIAGKSLSEGTDAAKELGDEAKKAPEGFVNMLAKFEAIGKLGEAFTAFGEKGIAVRDAMTQVAAATGSTASEMEWLKKAAEDAFVSGVGESVAESIKIMGSAKRLLGEFLKGDDLVNFTKGAAALGKTFDIEVVEVLGSARTFIANFGLDGQKAFELISYGMQATGSKSGDFLETLDEYSQLMVKAGFSAEEFVGVLANGMKEGTRDTDKLADAIKETQIRLNAGDTTKALADITSPISAQINGIANLAQTGQMSVKDMMQKTTSLLAESASNGQITAAIRDQYAVALSGTMAEDMGGELWSKVFSAKIDTNSIAQQAKLAGDTVTKALGPVSFTEKISKEIELLTTKASEVAAPLASMVGGLVTTFAQVAPGISLITSNFDNITKYGGQAFSALKGAVGTAFTSIKAAFVGGEVSATAFWSAATIGLALAIPALIALYEYFEPFTKLVDGVALSVKDGFNTAVNYISAFASNSGAIIGALFDYALICMNPVNWITDSGAEARKKAGDTLSKAINGALKDAQNSMNKDGLGKAITDSVSIKGDLDKNNNLKTLIDKFKNAKTEAEKNNLASAIQESVPGAVKGIKTVVDEHGKIKEVYDININKAEEFQKAQEKSLNGANSGNTTKFRAGILALSDDYDKAKAKMEELQAQIVKNPGDAGLRESFNKAKKEVEETGVKLGTTVAEGRKLGLVSGDANAMAKELGLGGDKAKFVAANIKNAETNAKLAASAVKDIGVAFKEAKDSADKNLQSLKDQMAALQYKKKTTGLSDADKETADSLDKQIKASRKGAEAYAEADEAIKKRYPGKAEREAAAVKRRQEELDATKKIFEANDKEIDHKRKMSLLEEGRSQNVNDQLKYSVEDIILLQNKLKVLTAIKGATKDQSESFKKEADAIRDAITQKGYEVEELKIQIKSAKVEFDKKLFENELKKTQFDIEIGVKDEGSLVELYRKQFARIQIEKNKLNADMAKADEFSKIEIMSKLLDLESQEIDLKKNTKDAETKLIDRQLKVKQEKYKEESDILEKKLTDEKAFYDGYYGQISDLGKSKRESDLAMQLENLDSLSKYDQLQVGDNEEAKKRIEEEYANKKLDLQRQYAKQAAVQDAVIAGEKLAFENEQSVKRMGIAVKQKEAEAQALADKGDYAGAAKLVEEFQAMEQVIIARKEPLTNSINELKAGIDPFMNSLFEGDEDGMKAAARKSLGNVVGYLKRLLSAYVIELVLTSPTFKAIASLAGPFAPAVTATAMGLLNSGMNAILSPIFSTILAFPTGASPAMLDKPTLMAGDGATLGGENREWILRDDQLRWVMNEVLTQFLNKFLGMFESVVSAINSQRIVGVIGAEGISLVTSHYEENNVQRTRV